MNLIKCRTRGPLSPKSFAFLAFLAGTTAVFAQSGLPTVQIQADKVTAKMPPTFYGLMTEEINYSYEGGLYGELIRNRTFKADAIQPRASGRTRMIRRKLSGELSAGQRAEILEQRRRRRSRWTPTRR